MGYFTWSKYCHKLADILSQASLLWSCMLFESEIIVVSTSSLRGQGSRK